MSNEPASAVSRDIKFGYDANATLTSVLDNFFRLLLRIKLTIRAHLMQLRKLLTFNPKPLVLRQMPMEDVELHSRHCIEISLQDLWRFVMSTNVNQQTTPAKARLVLH